METNPLEKSAPFYIAGHHGMVGSAIWRALNEAGFTNLIGRNSSELDLRDRNAVFDFMGEIRPTYLVLSAAKVGGIGANNAFPVDFLSDNVQIQVNVIDAAIEFGVERLAFLGSSCAYPKYAPQPLKPEYLLGGELEPTNEAYAIAKIAGIQHIKAARKQYGVPWISVMPTNLYGPGDNYTADHSHVIAAMIKRYSDAAAGDFPSLTNWGTGSPQREFMFVEDFAKVLVNVLEEYEGQDVVNVGSGQEITIYELSELIREATGFKGEVLWDHQKPDGVARKAIGKSKWLNKPTSLEEGISLSLTDYRRNLSEELS